MILSAKIDRLKPLVNYDYNSFVRETLEYPYDFIKAVEYALRRIGENNRIMERTFYIPTVSDTRLYELSLPSITSKQVEFLKLLDLAIVTFDTDGAQVFARVNENWFETIETNSTIDYYELSKFVFGEKVQFKSNLNLDSVALGVFDTLTSVSSAVVRIGTFANAVVGYNMINLDKANAGIYSYKEIASLSTPDITLESAPSGWAVGDKVYICDGLPPMIGITCQVIIQDGYFGDDETATIPIPANLTTFLDHFCIKYLYDLLVTRDVKQADVYAAKLKTGLVKPEEMALKEIRAIINSASTGPIVKSYSPLGKTNVIYGR